MEPDRLEMRRLGAFDSMSPALKAAALRLQPAIAALPHGDLMLLHDAGTILRAVWDDQPIRFGDDAVDKLGKFFNCSIDKLCDLRAFADRFSRKQLTGWSQRTTVRGDALSYEHFRVVSKLQLPTHIESWLEVALRESLTARQLRNRLCRALGRKYTRL